MAVINKSAPAGQATRIITWQSVAVWPPRVAVERLVRRRFARDVAFLQASNTLQKIYGLIFNAACVRLLGLSAYGEFLLVLSLYNTINVLGSLGLGQFLVVPLAQAAAARDRQAIRDAAGFNVKSSAIIALGVLTLALAIGPWFGDLLMHRPDLGQLMRVVALGGLQAVAYNVATTALQAARRMRELAIVENVEGICSRGGAIAGILLGGGLAGLLWGMVAGSACSAVFALYQYRRIAVAQHDFPGFRDLIRAAIAVPFRRYFRFGFLAVIDKNVAQLFGQTPLLFLGRWAGPEQAAYFGVASKVFTLLAAFHGAVAKALSARLSQEFGARGPASTRTLFWRSSLVWGGISILVSAAFLLLLPAFKLVYGDEAFPSFLLIVLSALITAKQGFTVGLGTVFLITNRVATNVLAKLPLIAVFVPIGMWMVQRWGAVGAAGYLLAAYAAGDLLYFSIIATPWFWRGAPPQASPPPSPPGTPVEPAAPAGQVLPDTTFSGRPTPVTEAL